MPAFSARYSVAIPPPFVRSNFQGQRKRTRSRSGHILQAPPPSRPSNSLIAEVPDRRQHTRAPIQTDVFIIPSSSGTFTILGIVTHTSFHLSLSHTLHTNTLRPTPNPPPHVFLAPVPPAPYSLLVFL